MNPVRLKHTIIFFLVILSLFITLYPYNVHSAEPKVLDKTKKKAFFYFGPQSGSETQFGPFNVFLSIGFGFMSLDVVNSKLSEIDISENTRTMFRLSGREAIIKEHKSISSFLLSEFVPILGKTSFPNYLLHFVGEGMAYRKLNEYFNYHGFSNFTSTALSAFVISLSQLCNEIIEAPYTAAGDALADFVFNAAGIIAFSFDGFARLFSNDYLKMYYWPGQPVIDVQDGVIYNQSESYLFRITLGNWTHSKLGFLAGLPAMGAGVSFSSKTLGLDNIMNANDMLSAFVVLHTDNMPEFPYKYLKPDLLKNLDSDGMVGVRLSWDRAGSLMSYIEYSKGTTWELSLNIYPGFLKVGSIAFGLFAHYSHKKESAIAITISPISVMPGFRR